ncbi:hypothetical protein D3C76_1848490 [compost metagenome]
MPRPLRVEPSKPMSARPKICQMVPTTFQGISRGIARMINTRDDHLPLVGMVRAMAMPRGISISNTHAE